MNQGKTWWYDLVAGLVNRILPNKKQHPSQYLISSNYNLDLESTILKGPQRDSPSPGAAFIVGLKQTAQTNSPSSGAGFSVCCQSQLEKYGVYLIAPRTGNQRSGQQAGLIHPAAVSKTRD